MKRKYVIAAGIIALMTIVATGCESGKKAKENNDIVSFDDKANESAEQQTQTDEMECDATKSAVLNGEGHNDDNMPDGSKENAISISQDSMIIGGKVRSITQDGFIISRVLIEEMEDTANGKGSIVVIPEAGSPEEELVTVRYTDLTTFECWIIQGGGAGIETKEAVFSDIQEGSGLEVSGYFDGEEFVAERVIIEIYE